MSEELKGMDGWLEKHFVEKCPYRTPEEFLSNMISRAENLNCLPEQWQALRETARKELLRINNPNTLAIIFGEQPCGLNEPPLILGKRVLAKRVALINREYGKGTRLVEYFAIGDVVGSEPGMYRATLSFPQKPEGIININFLSGNVFDQSPAFEVRAELVRIKEIVDTLFQIYGKTDPLYNFIGQLYTEVHHNDNQPFAMAQTNLLLNLERKLGLGVKMRLYDTSFDTSLARLEIEGKLAIELLIDSWHQMLSTAKTFDNKTARIPESEESPFYIYGFEDEEGRPIRPRVWFADDTLRRFVATHPFDSSRIISEFDLDHLLAYSIPLTFRAIPRAFLFALICDGHISAGGARYNEIVKPTFETILRVPYYPTAWMDLVNEEGIRQGVFQYNSAALRKEKLQKLPGYQSALQAVQEGRVSMLDLALSLSNDASERIRNVIEDPNFSMSTRIDLSNY